MNTAKEIAQWVINHRFPNNDTISNEEMYHQIVIAIETLQNKPIEINCSTCRHEELSKYVNPCYSCLDYDNHQIKQ